jgi:hypothetical protein
MTDNQQQSPADNRTTVCINYHVTAEQNHVEISYNNSTNGMNHEEATGEWDKTILMPIGSFAYITAQNQGYDRTCVSVSINCNGREMQRSESKGAYAIATASARCYTGFERQHFDHDRT